LTGVDDGKPKTKCQSLKVLTQTDSLSANIKPIVDSLKMKTSESKEWYINFRKKMNYGEVYSVPENGGIKESNSIENAKAYVGTFWFGQIHTHPDTRYNMFSWLDLRAMKEIHSEVHSSFKDDAFLMFVGNNGEVYALKVDDITTLTTVLDADFTNAKGKNDKAKEDYIEVQLAKEYKKSNNLEKTFLKLYGNHGISLYKAIDNNLSNWKQLELDDEDDEIVNENICN